jgi:hypothetical protein
MSADGQTVARPRRAAGVLSPARDLALPTEVAALAALTILAIVLRASQLHQSLIGDEVFTYRDIIHRSFTAVLTTVNTGGENSPPLFFGLAWGAAHFGDPTVWIRLPSVVFGSATPLLAYAVGRETFGRAAGLIAAGVLAVAPFAVYYGVEARPYATMTFFVALSTYALLRAVRTPGRHWWLLYVLAAAAAAYSHYTAVFVLGTQGVWSLWVCRRRLRTPLLANALAALLYLPWLPHLRGKLLSVIGALYPLGAHRVLTDVLRPVPGHPSAPLHAIPTVAGFVAIAASLVAGVLALARRHRSHTSKLRPTEPQLLIGLLALATPIGLLLYSLLFTDLWLPRGLSASMPMEAVLIGAVLSALPTRPMLVAASVVLVTLFAGTLRSFDPVYTRGPFRAIAAYLDRVAPSTAPVTVISYIGLGPLQIQLHRPHRLLTSLPQMWSTAPATGLAYVVLDDEISRVFKVPVPRPRGFTLIARKHYAGSFPTEVLAYRRTGG